MLEFQRSKKTGGEESLKKDRELQQIKLEMAILQCLGKSVPPKPLYSDGGGTSLNIEIPTKQK